jgi:hypothetical protein
MAGACECGDEPPGSIKPVSFKKRGCGCEDWIGLAQDRDRWRALVNAVMKLRVP